MARRKQSLFENVIDLSSKLPWWVGVVCAIASFIWFQGEASGELTAAIQSGKLGALAGQNVVMILSAAGQFGLPAVFLLAAAMSAYGRFKQGDSNARTVLGPPQGALGNMTWRQFEVMLGQAFRRKGYTVTLADDGGASGATDLVLIKDGKSYLVLCKQWRAIKLGERSLRELHEHMVAKGAAGGFAVTSGVFTDNACAFAAGHGIDLMDGKALQSMMSGIRTPGRIFRDPLSVLTTGAPFCPECQSRMVLRKSKQGAQAGKRIWRCSRYPDCMGKRPV